MIGITVSTRYAKLLEKVIHQNQRFFDTWLIVTSEDDAETLCVIRESGYKHIIPLFFDFKAGGKVFNKGGAIRYAQLELPKYASGSDTRVLILDSDIYLPDRLLDMLPEHVPVSYLYGVSQRNDYYSWDHFTKNKIDRTYIGSTTTDRFLHFVGFFQLYSSKSLTFYPDSETCAECDMRFANGFTHTIVIPGLEVSHLGVDGKHWKGRTDYRDFRF